MEPTCALCQKTVKQIAEEELSEGFSYTRKSLKVSLSDELCYPYLLCDTCEDFLRLLIPKIMEAKGIIKFDEKKDKWVADFK